MAKEFFLQQREKEFYETFGASYEDLNQIQWLMGTSAIPEHIEREIRQRLYAQSYLKEEAEETINYLKENQRDPIDGGFNYNQTDIKWKLKKF